METNFSMSLKESDFSASAATLGTKIQVTFQGTADLTVKSQLDRFLADIHTEASQKQVEEVMVDVRQLAFINSSCLKSFVWWIGTVQERLGTERYRIVFVSSPSIYWQRRSLNALACLAGDIISVQS